MTLNNSVTEQSGAVILVIDDDDELTSYIKSEIEHQFPGHTVLLCHTGDDTRRQLERLELQVGAAVFDSGFGKNKLAGCELFLDLIGDRPWLRHCSFQWVGSSLSFGSPIASRRSHVPSPQAPTATMNSSHSGNAERMLSSKG